MTQRYGTARAFRQALEQRLNQEAMRTQTNLLRLRRTVAFDRFLARLFAGDSAPWLLKGGYAMELRLHDAARATKDVDLSILSVDPAKVTGEKYHQVIREQLQESAARDLGDWFVFFVGAPSLELDAAPYGGAQFPVEARLAGREFSRFHLDVGIGDAIVGPPEWIVAEDLLDFAGIPPARVAMLPKHQQFAEKVHAFTYPWADRQNTRVKDLVDLVLLIDLGLPAKDQVIRAIQATFHRRATHAIPATLPAPPEIWNDLYETLAAECGVRAKDLWDAYQLVATYWESLGIRA